ncbi:MAG: tetratricopeptide repeat protein [Promethearchaeota archaeon]|jgi:tetratricopeptide (TPR) repeat protein
MPRYPNKVIEFINKLPEGQSGLKKLIKRNYKKIDFDKLNPDELVKNEKKATDFYETLIKEILSLNPGAIELLKNLSVINLVIATNIDRQSLEISYESAFIQEIFNVLLETRILRKKVEKKEIYEFAVPQIKEILESQAEKESHIYALKYYEIKTKKFRGNYQDVIEVLFHKVKINPTHELVNEFFVIAEEIGQIDNRYGRLIDIALELLVLEEKYRGPILFALGNIISIIGNPEDAEKIYLSAIEVYKNLAKQYYRIYLPYIAAIQKHLGKVYIDLKRFEEAEKIYSDALSSYREIEKQFYDVHSPSFDVKTYRVPEKSNIDELKAYNDILKRHYDIYLPYEPATKSHFGNLLIDPDFLEDIKDGSLDSLESYKKMAKMGYDMYLVSIAKTLSNLGLTYSEQMKVEEAEQMHLEALKIKRKIAENYPDQVLPELALTFLDLGDLYASLDRFEDAEPMFKRALGVYKKLAEQSPDIYLYNIAIIQNSLGTIYTKLKNFEEAELRLLESLKSFKIFAKKDPKTYKYNVANVQNNLGHLFLTQRDLEQAEHYMNKALKKDPSNLDILYNIASLETLKNNQLKALELLKRIIEIDKNYIERVLSDDKFEGIKGLNEFKELINR